MINIAIIPLITLLSGIFDWGNRLMSGVMFILNFSRFRNIIIRILGRIIIVRKLQNPSFAGILGLDIINLI